MAIYLPELGTDPATFPAPEYALKEPNGLLAFGGDLSPARLLAAYRRGIFPWFNPGEPILWWSPNPRCILRPTELHVSRSLAKQMRKGAYSASLNLAFADVITACAAPRHDQAGTWLSDQMQHAYRRLHQMGYAHSFEVWRDNQLIGGLYGISLGRCFFGESMFHRADNGSKMALVALSRHAQRHGINMIDCQITNGHLLSMGAREVPRGEFLGSLIELVQAPLDPHCWQGKRIELLDG